MSRKSLGVLVAMLLFLTAALTAQVRAKKPNDFTIELGGRCAIYSLGYQRNIVPAFALDAAISYIGGGGSEGNAGVLFLTGGAKLYMLKKPASPYLSGGIAWVSAATGAGFFSSNSASTVYGYVSPGFEYRAESGFVFRGGLYILLVHSKWFVWPGISGGIAF